MLDVVTVLLFVAVFALSFWYLRLPSNLPPGPPNWPILGFLTLSRPKNRLEFLDGLRKKYGDIFVIWQGSYPMVIIYGPDLIREALVDNAEHLSERPTWMHLNQKINKGKGIIWSRDNWRGIRKFALNSLRDFGAGPASLEGKIQLECEQIVEAFKKESGQPFDCHNLVVNAVSNIICSIVFGQRYEYDDPAFLQAMRTMDEAFKSGIIYSRLNYFPWLAAVVWKMDVTGSLGRFAYKLEAFVQEEIDKHRMTFDPAHIRDFIDLYLQAEVDEQNQQEQKMTNGDLRRAVIDLFSAGTETTGTTIQWLFVYMILHPQLQDKCRKEIHEVIGTERLPRMSDRSKLVYTEAVLLETQRLANIAPWTLPHSCHVPVTVGGYTIPKDSIVLPILRSSHMDSAIWEDAEVFRPERWIQDGKVNPKHPAFMPFSLGRRQCPGEQIARMELFLFGVTFLQQFSLQAADIKPSMEGHLGLTLTTKPFLMKAVPVNV